MKYSAGIVSRPFWYQETRMTSKLINEGLDIEIIKEKVINKNIFQVSSQIRAKQIIDTIIRRLSSIDEYMIKEIENSDLAISKLLVLISIMKTDLLFFEFIYEVFREKIILGEYMIQDKNFHIFLDHKKCQSEVVNGWTEYTFDKIKSSYSKLMFEAGIIDNSRRTRKIIQPIFDRKIIAYMKEHDMEVYINALTGER